MKMRSQLVAIASSSANATSLTRVRSVSRLISPYSSETVSATTKKCSPLQPSAISNVPSGNSNVLLTK